MLKIHFFRWSLLYTVPKSRGRREIGACKGDNLLSTIFKAVLPRPRPPALFFEQAILIHCWAWHWGQSGVRNKPPHYMIIKVIIRLNYFKVVLCQSHLWMRPCNQIVLVSFNKHRCSIASFQWLPHTSLTFFSRKEPYLTYKSAKYRSKNKCSLE